MQDRYVGDIGDYGKLTLLRHLARTTDLKVGIVWCATDGRDEKNNDGSIRSYRSYTGKHCLRHCDEELFVALSAFDDERHRKIENLEPLTLAHYFFREELTSADRTDWNERAQEEMKHADLVFFDPDNGIASNGSKLSPKHISIPELYSYWERKKSLIVYHHQGRQKGGYGELMPVLKKRVESNLHNARVVPLHFRRGSCRTYYLIIHPDHEERLKPFMGIQPWTALLHTKSEWAKVPH